MADSIEVIRAQGFYPSLLNGVLRDGLPQVLTTETPLEIQLFDYAADGTVTRSAFGYQTNTLLEFAMEEPSQAFPHRHDYIEIVAVLRNYLDVEMESHSCRLHEGDVCVLNASTFHGEWFKPDTLLAYVTITPAYLDSFPKGERLVVPTELRGIFDSVAMRRRHVTKEFAVYRPRGSGDVPVFDVLQQLRNTLRDKMPGFCHYARGQLQTFMSVLADDAVYQAEYVGMGLADDYSIALSAKRLLDREQSRMTREQVALRLGCAPAYLDRAFRKTFGCTVSMYGKKRCMGVAARLLVETREPVASIAHRCGYVNRTSFYSTFREEYGCSPGEYRKRESSLKADNMQEHNDR